MDLRDFVEFHVEKNPTHAKIIWIFCLDFQSETFNFLFQMDFLPRTLLSLKKSSKLKWCVQHWQDFQFSDNCFFCPRSLLLPQWIFQNCHQLKISVIFVGLCLTTPQIFPFALCHFHSYPILVKHWFSKFSRLPVICLSYLHHTEVPFL